MLPSEVDENSQKSSEKATSASDLLANGLTSSETHTLQRLNNLVGDETLAFVKAKEEFKKSKNAPGILYSDVIRQCFSSVPYFHYAEDNR